MLFAAVHESAFGT